MPVNRVAIYARPDKEEALELAREAFRILSEEGVEVFYEASIADKLGGPGVDLGSQSVDAVVVIGGDGSLLRVLQLLKDRSPIIHLVRMGRRTVLYEDVEPRQSIQDIRGLLRGEYRLDVLKRLRVKALGREFYALNEAAILALGSKIVRLQVAVDDEPVYPDLTGDGVIVSTPVGSTAYNYSAGGPILHLGLEALVLTPVNPVDRSAGSVVVPGESTVRIMVKYTLRPVRLIVDGAVELPLTTDSVVEAVFNGPPVRIARYTRPSRLKAPWLKR